ncbi:MAG: RraA family protein [Candidatus Thorarchaeota archaeon]|nr:RraA family protein [Candidatus Thorarchaeota archaeon]
MPGNIYTKINRPSKEIIDLFKEIPTGIASDAQGRSNTMHAEIKGLKRDWRILGPAITVRCMAGNNLAIHQALYLAEPGDIIVVDGTGITTVSLWGTIMTEVARSRDLAGVVIDGSIRDFTESVDLNFPIFCRGVTPRGPHKGWSDDINVPISCGGVPVHPGDIILGDGDGVVVIPKGMAKDISEKAERQMKKEKAWLEEIRKGKTTLEAIGLQKNVDWLGVNKHEQAYDD